jgi:hypothetical protein
MRSFFFLFAFFCFGFTTPSSVSLPQTTSSPLLPQVASTSELPQAASTAKKVLKLNSKLWTFDHIEQNAIFFQNKTLAKNPFGLKVNLFNIKYLGSIRDSRHEPYFLFSARPCDTCKDQSSIYALRPSLPRLSSFISPGKILDPKTKQTLLESRAFFGKCLIHEPSEVLIVFQREKIDRKKNLQYSVFIAQPTETFLKEKLIEGHRPYLTQTLKLVQQKWCTEIQGTTRIVPNQSMSLKSMTPHPQESMKLETLEDVENDAF